MKNLVYSFILSIALLRPAKPSCDFTFISCVDVSKSVTDAKQIGAERFFVTSYYNLLRDQAENEILTAILSFNDDTTLNGKFTKVRSEIYSGIKNIRFDIKKQGTNLGSCLRYITEKLEIPSDAKKVLLILTDADDNSITNAAEKTKEMIAGGFVIQVAGFGKVSDDIYQLTSKNNIYREANVAGLTARIREMLTGVCLKWQVCKLPPKIEHALMASLAKCVNYLSQEVCTYTCKKGYSPSPAELVCKGNLGWEVGRCRKNCVDAPGKIDYAKDPKLTSCKDAKDGVECVFSCNDGYKKKGTLFCYDGRWAGNGGLVSQEAATCEPTCPSTPDFFPNCDKESLRQCSGSGLRCDFSCEKGYVPSGGIVCDPPTNMWASIKASCGYVCKDPVPSVPFSDKTSFGACSSPPGGSECRFLCEKGYVKEGRLVCEEGFGWRNESAQCVTYCSSQPEILHALADSLEKCKKTTLGLKCSVLCGKGYRLYGEAPECLDNGSWSTIRSLCGLPPLTKGSFYAYLPGVSSVVLAAAVISISLILLVPGRRFDNYVDLHQNNEILSRLAKVEDAEIYDPEIVID